MIKIGVVGEDPNDSDSIINLLSKRYSGKARFVKLAYRVTGEALETDKLFRAIAAELKSNKCKFIIYTRDLDGYKSESHKTNKRLNWFNAINTKINNNGLLLLNVWELEALILADIGTFNSIYRITHSFKGDPSVQKNPKEILKRLTNHSAKQYSVSHCPDIFKKLNIDTVIKNCSYFGDFIKKLETKFN
jgi:hypothetical protein